MGASGCPNGSVPRVQKIMASGWAGPLLSTARAGDTPMTVILFGERELMLAQAPTQRVVVCPDESIEKGSQLELPWRQNSLRPCTVAFIDPPDPVKAITPRPDRVLMLPGEPRKPWKEWAAKHNIPMQACQHPPANQFVYMLTSGASGITFTEDAAEWYARMVGTSRIRLENELIKFAVMGKTRVTREMVITLIGGFEDLKADRVLKALGTARACKLALEVTEKRAMPLLGYFDKALQHRKNSWWLAVHYVREGMIAKMLTPWSAVQVFVQYCYETQNSSRPEADCMLELMSICGQFGEDLEAV